jgi:hypothetical protein
LPLSTVIDRCPVVAAMARSDTPSDRVVVQSRKVGQAEREGMVTGVVGRLLTVKWATGEESTFAPGPGAVAVVGKVRAAAGKKAPASR